MKPFFSIITPTFNRAEFLDRCIRSVQQQSFADWEMLLVDDGSTDGTRTLVQNYAAADSRIRYIYQDNQKTSAARNNGLAHATGQYICFIDSDDEYDTGHLQFFYDQLKKDSFPEHFLFTRFRFADGDSSQDYNPPASGEYGTPELTRIMQVFLPYSPPVQTICLPGDVRNRIKFDTRLFPSECYDFCARVAALYPVKYFPVTTVTLHGHAKNASVPRTPQDEIRFNRRQYEEFMIMKNEPFFRRIRSTKAFRQRMFFLQYELAKNYLKRKEFTLFSSSFAKGIRYNPAFFMRLAPRVLKKLFAR
jgi:glycosyltransferase involved in cell wall biosynthesis